MVDPLGQYRDRFVVDDPDLIYLDGNSLGRMPREAADKLKHAIDHQWGHRLIQSWGEGWYGLPQRLGAKIAGLVGAQPDEVLCCDSTSVNFYKLVSSVLAGTTKTKVVTDNLNFPSDVYLLQGCTKDLVVVESSDGIHVPGEQIEAALDEQTALLTLSHVAFKSSFRHDMDRLTRAAHAKGIPVLWDLSHSVGAVPLDLNGCEADYAVGCTYKYLNGGPGAPAFLYVRKDLQEKVDNPIWGWFGQNRPFDFTLQYQPAEGLNRMLTGTPPILSMLAIEAGVDMLLEAGMEAIWEKSQAMYRFAYDLWEQELAPLGIGFGSPQPAGLHGSHITLTHPEAHAIDQALIQNHKVIPDFRAPDGIRFGLVPLYTTFHEIERALEAVKLVLTGGEHKQFSGAIEGVT